MLEEYAGNLSKMELPRHLVEEIADLEGLGIDLGRDQGGYDQAHLSSAWSTVVQWCKEKIITTFFLLTKKQLFFAKKVLFFSKKKYFF